MNAQAEPNPREQAEQANDLLRYKAEQAIRAALFGTKQIAALNIWLARRDALARKAVAEMLGENASEKDRALVRHIAHQVADQEAIAYYSLLPVWERSKKTKVQETEQICGKRHDCI